MILSVELLQETLELTEASVLQMLDEVGAMRAEAQAGAGALSALGVIAAIERGSQVWYAIRTARDPHVVGLVWFTRCESRQVSWGTVSVSYVVAPSHVGRGIGRNGLGIAMRRVRESRGAAHVTARIAPLNKPSQRVAEACGFTYFGLRSMILATGIWWDYELWAIALNEARSRASESDCR